MKLLNLGCGYPRIEGEDWVNLDNLLAQLREGSPERANLLEERNYVEHDVLSGPLPFADSTFNGCLLSHVLEHFDCQQAVAIMVECRRVLQPGGVLLASVPNASYFRQVYADDRVQNWPRLFGVTDPGNTIPTFFDAALWFDQHKAILTEDAMWCYFRRAGFFPADLMENPVARQRLMPRLNRRPFSVEMLGQKPF